MDDKLQLKGQVALVLKDKDGKVKQQKEVNNLIVDTGLNFICDRMKDATESVMSHMGVGSNSTAAAAGDTDLGTLLGSREALDSTTVTNNQIVFVASFEANDGTGTIEEAGVFNAATGGTMLCRVLTGTITKSASDTLTITWTITLSAS